MAVIRRQEFFKSRRSSPVPFFSGRSSVVDYYDGRLADGNQLLNTSEMVFAMYYAPWCLASIEARDQFDALATHFGQRRGLFVAVNCWDPGGRCRQEKKMHGYPLLELSTTANARLRYRGVVSADHMYRFLEVSTDPLQRLQNDMDVTEFLAMVEARVVGYFNFDCRSKARGYTSFYLASLKALEKDPLRNAVVFAVVTDPMVATKLNLTDS
ncbi:unnamed protein product, partial [Soboliphyme baturini]|uniref:Thioredoxin domain-containing protein n=1 Tax=Soboliphyme baturini TaxID=241478 RepID=A0A183JAK4_9BILA